jgi:hypothetical protein
MGREYKTSYTHDVAQCIFYDSYINIEDDYLYVPNGGEVGV